MKESKDNEYEKFDISSEILIHKRRHRYKQNKGEFLIP